MSPQPITLQDLLAKEPAKFTKLTPEKIRKLDSIESGLIVDMMKSGITNAGSKYHILGIRGADPCTGILAYNPATKTVGAYHALTDKHQSHAQLKEMIDRMRRNKEEVIHIRLFGAGQYGESVEEAQIHFQPILDTLNSIPNIEVLSADILEKPHPTTYAIDARTGKIYRGSTDISRIHPNGRRISSTEVVKQSIVDVGCWDTVEERLGIEGFFDGTEDAHKRSRARGE